MSFWKFSFLYISTIVYHFNAPLFGIWQRNWLKNDFAKLDWTVGYLNTFLCIFGNVAIINSNCKNMNQVKFWDFCQFLFVVFKLSNIFVKICLTHLVTRGVDSFLNPGGLAVVWGAKSAHPGLNRVNWSAKFWGGALSPRIPL